MPLSAALRPIAMSLALLIVPAECLPADEKPAAPPPPSCTAPEYRQFDFWLGEWEVRGPAGKFVGRNNIASVHKGCAIEESYTANGGFSGSSLNIYDTTRKKWHQTWVDSSGGLLQLDGGIVDGNMVLTGVSPSASADKGMAPQRITWSPMPDGRVRQLWEASADGGRTWTVAFDGYYSRIR